MLVFGEGLIHWYPVEKKKTQALIRQLYCTYSLTGFYIHLISKCNFYYCTLTNRNEQYLRIFEGRISKKIYSPMQNEDGSWGIRMNNKLIEKRKHSEIYKK